MPRVGSFPLRNFDKKPVKGFEGRNFEIRPCVAVRLSIFKEPLRDESPRLDLYHLQKPYATKFERYHKTSFTIFNKSLISNIKKKTLVNFGTHEITCSDF